MAELSVAEYQALIRLVTEMAWRIDHKKADTVYELCTFDATLVIGGPAIEGREAIIAWGKQRAAVDWVTRHVCSNMRFVSDGPGRAHGTTTVTVYRKDSQDSVPAIPRMVAEYRDEFVREEDGWKFSQRITELLFVHS